MKRLPGSPRLPGLPALLALFLLASCNWQRPQPGFTLSLNPTSLTVQQGASGQTTLTVTPQNGFTGTVSLSLVAGQDPVPQGLTLSPGSLQVSGASPVNQTLTLSAQAATPTGTYRLKVRATSGGLTREAGLTVTVSASGGGGAGEVQLPPPVSGQGFPQPPLEVGPPEQGAALLGQDRLERVLITPQAMTLTPGEERFLSVWVETESGQRYAGDERYLELRWAGPQGYQVAWAGPGRVRVRAPAAFAEETLFISVYRRDLSQAQGKTFLSSVATVGMVEPKPGVVVIPEELVGLPVAYDLDQATLLARLSLFQLEDLGRALDLDGSDGVVTYPALVRIDEARGITAERLRGQLIVGEGEASPLMGRVREVVAQRLDVLLLAVEPALPWEVYARYQGEFDLEAVARQGVLLIDTSRSETPSQPGPQGMRPLSQGQGEGGVACSPPKAKVGAPVSLDDGVSFAFSLGIESSCQLARALELTLSFGVSLGADRLKIKPERVYLEGFVAGSGGLEVALKAEVTTRYNESLVLFYNCAPVTAWGGSVCLDVSLDALRMVELAQVGGEGLELPQDVKVVAVGANVVTEARFVYDSAADPSFRPTMNLQLRPFLRVMDLVSLEAQNVSSDGLTFRVGSDLFAFGLGFDVFRGLKDIVRIVQLLTRGENERYKDSSLVVLGVYVNPVTASKEFRYAFFGAAMRQALGGEAPEVAGGVAFEVYPKVKLGLKGAWARSLAGLLGFEGGLTLEIPLRQFGFQFSDTLQVSDVGFEPTSSAVRVRGRLAPVLGRFEVRAYRLAELRERGGNAQPLASAETRTTSFTLDIPVPPNCENLAPEERTAVVLVRGHYVYIPSLFEPPLGWAYAGQVDLCSPIALEVPALRAFVGETAQGQGTARNGGGREVALGLAAQEVTVSPTSLSLPAGGSAPFSVSYACTEEGSFVGQVAAQLDGRTVARAPAVVTCIPDEDNDPSNNPSSDRSLDRAVRFWGDPHLITPDGAAYDFHATGEFWAVEHPAMPLQLRFLPMPENPQATYTARLAARLGQARVEVRPLAPGEWGREGNFLPEVALAVLVEGEDRTGDLARRGYLELPGDGYVAVSRWAQVFRNNVLQERRPLEVVLVYPGTNPRPAVAVRAERIGQIHALAVGAVRPQGLAGALRGLMGNANGDPNDDFATRDGVRLTPPLAFGTLYQTFGRSWEVRSGERLFTDPAPQARYPEAPPALDPERVREAEAFCADIPDPYLRQACILDGAVTGDYQGAARAAQEVAEAREGTSGGTIPATRSTSLGLAPGTLRLTASGAGDLTVANRGD
ncbi:COG1470 family protein, partial [Fervidobacterium sp.]